VRTKDRPELLKTALLSIFNQTYRPIEVILINDGGCDLPEEELDTILGDIHLNYIRLQKNSGRARAGNTGIENAKGDYIGFLDDDDTLYPEHVTVLADYLQQGDLKIAYTDSLMVYKGFDSRIQESGETVKRLVYSQDFDYDNLIFENYIPFMCLLFDREVLVNSGGLDDTFEVYEDYDLLIRLGENYRFHHIKQTTADYNQWSSDSQISRENGSNEFLKESYLRLFSKHIDKFTPDRIYNYRAKKYTEISEKDAKIGDLQNNLKSKDAHIVGMETLIRDKDAHLKNLHDVIKAKDQYITSIVSKLQQSNTEIVHKNREIKEKEDALNTIYNSQGWKVLLKYYKIRDTLLPPDSLRRGFVRGISNRLFSLSKSLTKKKTEQADKKFLFHIETDLSKPFVIGAGNALYLRGWCYHTLHKIKRLFILADSAEHQVFNHSFVRYDIFNEHTKTLDPKGHSLHSGFWVVLPFEKIDSECKVSLSIRAELSDGEVSISPVGVLNLKTAIMKSEYTGHLDDKSSESPLVAICMATYNPSMEHLKRQINSIMHQTHANWICIINDDCSEPEKFEQIKRTVSADVRFKVYRNSANLGFYYNFEKCLSYVPQEVSFIALADQDDYWHEDKLASLLREFDEKTMLVYSDMNIVDKDGNIQHSTYWTTRKNNFTELDLLLIANTVTGAASLFRIELLPFLLPFPEKIGDAYHDNFIASTALSLGEIRYVDRPLYDYYQHEGSIIGHCVPQGEKSGEKNKFFSKLGKDGIKHFLRDAVNRLKSYRMVYFDHYVTRVLIANVLNLRCGDAQKKKRKIIRRFALLEKSMCGLIYQVIKDKILRKNLITIGVDTVILKSAFANKLINAYYRFNKIFSYH
jgi:glycosyltransferase involved in cell wall biosynthesis